MVYSFDPKYWNGTIFLFKEWRMEGNSLEYVRNNQPIPTSFFPKTLTIERASAALPDLFHTYRGCIVLSERARRIIEKLAPGQVEFIPVTIETAATTWQNPLIDAYYTIKDSDPYGQGRFWRQASLQSRQSGTKAEGHSSAQPSEHLLFYKCFRPRPAPPLARNADSGLSSTRGRYGPPFRAA